MKLIPCTLCLIGALAPTAWSQNVPANRMRDAATHEQISQDYRKFSQEDPMRNLKRTQGVDPSVVNRPKDIVSESDVICFNGMATLVPKRAILKLPANMSDRLKFQPGMKLVSWSDFYTANRGWITTQEVSRSQAEGNDAFNEKVTDHISKSGNLIVATYMGGPISVLPLKVPAVTETAKAESHP
jgi:hypothetical protein